METILIVTGIVAYTAIAAGIGYAIGKVVGAVEQFDRDWRKEGEV